jgi:hypothetical protein
VTDDPRPPLVVTLRSAEELIDALRPTSPRWAPDPSDWIFRGQRDATWRLLPSAFRREAWEEFACPGDEPFSEHSGGVGTIPSEFVLLERFLAGLDRGGLDVPNGIFLPQLFEAGPAELLRFPLDPAALTFVALAQHHGIPTRLLDWTRVGVNAAYFAAAGAAKQKDRSGNMSVWAFRPSFAEWCQEALGDDHVAYRPKLGVVTAPGSSNPNLHAQSGLFTETRTDNAASIEEIVRSLRRTVREVGSPWTHGDPLLRLDLPCAESPKLLRLLSHEQVDAARMFPGREGVVVAMKDRRLWDW